MDNQDDSNVANAKPGRPWKYKPEHCEELIELMSKGLSFEASAAAMGFHKDTLYNWVKHYPDFKEAKEIATAKSLLFWEKLGIDHIINKSESYGQGEGSSSRSLNAAVWCFNMKNRFQWRDKQKDESEVVVNNNISQLSDEELENKIKKYLEKA